MEMVGDRATWRARLSLSGGSLGAAIGVGALVTTMLPGLYQGNQLGQKVGIVGDSITCLSAKHIEGDFNARYSFQIGCKDGITITQGTQYAQQIDKSVEGSPTAFVVNLGTNDALQDEHDIGPHNNNDIGAVWRDLTQLDDDLSNVGCVVWVTVNEIPDVYGSHVAAAINDWIHARAATRPGNFELNWWGLLQQGDNGKLWLSDRDGIHTTHAGQQKLADLYLQAVQKDCPAGTVPAAPSPPSTP